MAGSIFGCNQLYVSKVDHLAIFEVKLAVKGEFYININGCIWKERQQFVRVQHLFEYQKSTVF